MPWYFEPRPSVAQRRVKAARALAKMKERGQALQPVVIEGRKIAQTFWGKAWCDNLESYRDYEYRLPRGRSYVRNGAVLDLQVKPGRIDAKVSGSNIYNIQVTVKTFDVTRWAAIRRQCAGHIGSLIELLQGKMSDQVMRVITHPEEGLFPKPEEIEMRCSCPDWAVMCKHVAAVMYGLGARLDHQPELLFTLRQLDHAELITAAADMQALTAVQSTAKTIASEDLSAVFGIELESAVTSKAAASPPMRKHAPKKKAKKTKKRHVPASPKKKAARRRLAR